MTRMKDGQLKKIHLIIIFYQFLYKIFIILSSNILNIYINNLSKRKMSFLCHKNKNELIIEFILIYQ